MKIGIPKEIKNNENRVALTPGGVFILVRNKHTVLIEDSAGVGSGFTNEEYEKMGGIIVATASEAWDAELVMKVKEPLEEEYDFFKAGLVLFTYLHLAPARGLTQALLAKKVNAIAYESVQLPDNSLPLLRPMSEVAGRMAAQIGAHFLQQPSGGLGILLAGVPGVERGRVTVIGGGVAGTNAAKMAIGLGAKVTILDVNAHRLAELDNLFGDRIQTLLSNPYNISRIVKESDLVIGAVLIPGHRAPNIVTEAMVKNMKPGSVIVDVAIDQGGIFETIDRVTTHDNPIYIKHDVVHYAVANMPGGVPRTSTFALTNCTLNYALAIADKGLTNALKDNKALFKGVNTFNGKLTISEVAEDQGIPYTSLDEILN